MDERVAIQVAHFGQRDRGVGVFGKMARHDAALGARADNALATVEA